MNPINTVNHAYDINIETYHFAEKSQTAMLNACEVALESNSETRCDDGGFDCAGTVGSAGTLGGTFGTAGTFGCCC